MFTLHKQEGQEGRVFERNELIYVDCICTLENEVDINLRNMSLALPCDDIHSVKRLRSVECTVILFWAILRPEEKFICIGGEGN